MPYANDGFRSTPGAEPNHGRHKNAPKTNGKGKGKGKAETTDHYIGDAADLIFDVKTLTKLCGMNASDAAQLGAILLANYKAMADQQSHRITASQKLYTELYATKRQESIVLKNIDAHYNRFSCEMQEAQTAMSDGHKQAMITDAINSINLATENSEFSRQLRAKIEALEAELEDMKREMTAVMNGLVSSLCSAVMRCLVMGTGAVEGEEGEGR